MILLHFERLRKVVGLMLREVDGPRCVGGAKRWTKDVILLPVGSQFIIFSSSPAAAAAVFDCHPHFCTILTGITRSKH